MLQAVIDLRSDTVTKPSAAMRAAMAAAEVGDDLLGEDPTVRKLEETVAARLGLQAGLFVPSGTMGNQLGVAVHVAPGDDVLCSLGAHIKWYEAGATAALSGAQLVTVGADCLFTADELRETFQPERADLCSPTNRLLCIENTHNRGGGLLWPSDQLSEVVKTAKELKLALHLDGARLWNAAIAQGQKEHVLCASFDTVTVCLSKGLGAPVGSVLCGSAQHMRRARHLRRRFGGSMRQSGVLAAAGLYALEHNLGRLQDDHDNAELLWSRLQQHRSLRVSRPQTNIVMVDLLPPLQPAQVVVQALRERGVLCAPFGPRRLRLVTHLDVDRAACDEAVQIILNLL